MESYRYIQPEDILNFSIPGCLSASRDGKTMVCQFKKTDGGQGYVSQIMMWMEQEGGFVSIGTGSNPRLSPDGDKVAWVDQDKIVVYQISTKKIMQQGGPFLRCRGLSWSPDSNRIAFTYANRLQREPENMPALKNVVWVDRLKFKSDGEGLCDGSYRHTGVYDLRNQTLVTIPSGKCDHMQPTFIDNDRVAYSAVLVNCDNSDLASVVVYNLATGEGKEYQGPGGPVTRLAGSHSGQTIAVLSHDNAQWEATNFKIYTLDLTSGEYLCRTAQFDRSVGNYASSKAGLNLDGYHLEWSFDDTKIYTLVTNQSVCGLYALDTGDGQIIKIIEPNGVIYDYASFAGGFFTLLSKDDELAVISRHTDYNQVIWRENSLDKCELSRFERFVFPGFDGTEREGFYMRPLGKQKGVVLDIHGGPHYSYGLSFSIDAQLFAANGYGVVFCNPAGSQAYGQAVAMASKYDWGGKDYREIMDCVGTACKLYDLARLPWGVVGGSYGGYMVNWVIGHTGFFQCAISERGSCNRYSQSGTSDCAYRYGEFEFTGYAWDAPEHYLEHSPITYVRNIQTPLLLIHGEQDMNCSISQSEEMYSACKLMGKDVFFARFPGQSHGFAAQGTPFSRIDRYKLLLWWMDRYLGEKQD